MDVIKKNEYLEYRFTGGCTYTPRLIKCPACGESLTDGTLRPVHIATHSPKEFGL